MTSSAAHGIRPPGYRLPDGTCLGRVRLQVSDIARSTSYYERVLGLRVLRHESHGVVLGPHGEDHEIVELLEDRRVRAAPPHGLLGLYHFAILLPDRSALGRFVRHLLESGERAGMSDHYVSEAVYLQDPDNLGIEVYADRPRDSWRYQDGQIAMTTVPLDVAGLVAAAGEQDWKGMPAGTRMGHVHLHVGDLERAAAFYHGALGFDKVVWSYPGALFLSAGGYHHHLGTNTWARDARSASDEDARLLEWEIVLPTRDDLKEAAASLAAARHEANWNGAENGLSSADPWGTRLRLIAP